MKTIRKTIAAALGGIIAAGMLSAMPAEAVREQLGTYRRVGDRGLYLSDSGAIQVDSENSSGVLFRIRLSEEEEPEFRNHIEQKIRMYVQNAEGDPDTRFVFQLEPFYTGYFSSEPDEGPFCTYTLTDKQQGYDFYEYAAQLYYYLSHSEYASKLMSYKYYPDFGCTNEAGLYGYKVSENPEMQENINAWLAENSPGVIARISDDPFYNGFLTLGWVETESGWEYEPYPPFHDIYGIWEAFGYVPEYYNTVLYRHGDEFAFDFMQWQGFYDNISDAEIQAAMTKYGLDQLDNEPRRLFLIFPFDTVDKLAARAGSTYRTADAGSEEAVLRDRRLAEMLNEAMNIGFAGSISWADAPEKSGYELAAAGARQGYAVRLMQRMGDDPAGEPDYLLKPQEAAHLLAYLDKYLGLPFGVSLRIPSPSAAFTETSFDDLMKLPNDKLSKMSGTDFDTLTDEIRGEANLNAPDGIVKAMFTIPQSAAQKMILNVVLESELPDMIDVMLYAGQDVAEYLGVPEDMIRTICRPGEFDDRLGDPNSDLTLLYTELDLSRYGEENRYKAYALLMQRLKAAGKFCAMSLEPTVPEGVTLGDVNLDGAADVADAVLLARYCVSDDEAYLTAKGLKNADVDYNRKVTAEDVTELLLIIAKKKTPLF